ncbi:phage antirepressor KilAC domain-containing protein [Pantoea sp. Mb-10]|uniref:phage antirepressor KilAC domain-containing protein n=1 Tax=unclassified Pantoea TaxID=2630326 RepID=UPI001E449F36|nr:MULTISPECIES: phage antirepressor KilAC domain-containing protein [unclassified Pantoea]MCE0491108.1 phage antirepressor KilAC domain-containing protein [Pantoea sp. Mb-10]MCE0502597.1 phage antirepressor KilAC domain-containing protein [Pantoea sp. Pb-8]
MMISMDNLSALNPGLTMSSREIARVTGNTHGEVKRLIKSLETAQRLSQPVTVNQFEHEGEMRQEFLLNKRDSLLAVARLSPGFTAELLDRWQAKEQRVQLPDFTNPAAAARAWAEQYEQRRLAEQQLAVTAPKAAFFDSFIETNETLGFRQLCKMLKVKESDFRDFLLTRNIMFRDKGVLTPQQHHLQAGYFTVRCGHGENEHAFSQARFTRKGVKWVANLWAGHVLTQPKGVAA